MKTTVISYSFTGNNKALAMSIASALSADLIQICDLGKRTMGTIALDMLFNRTPRVSPSVTDQKGSDLIIFLAPVWMGQVASPLRACFKELKPDLKQYAFVTISGSAMGPNTKLGAELKKRLQKEPAAVIDLPIVDLIPTEPKPTREMTSAYRLKDEDIKSLTEKVMMTLKDIIA